MKPRVAIVRGKFLNRYEMQFFEPLTRWFDLTGVGSLTPFQSEFAFPVINLPSPMDLPEFPYKMPILNRIFTDAQYLIGLERRLQGFDLVHTAETYYRYTQQCLDAKREGYVKKVIATVLENIPFNNEGIRGRNAYKARARNELDHIIALTRKTKEALLTEGADPMKITVIPHFVDTMRFAPTVMTVRRRLTPRKKDFTILFTGRLEEYKGVLEILVAANRLIHSTDLNGYDLRFLFVGKGHARSRMEAFVRETGMSRHVSLTAVSYDQMPGIYEKADIFIAPSKPTPTWEEQYCTALLEAQAAGLPIVTTRSGGIPENVGRAAILVSPGNITELSAALVKLIRNPGHRRILGQKARRRAVTVHDIRFGARAIREIYRHVLSL